MTRVDTRPEGEEDGMRWELLFEDLEAQLEAEDAAGLDAEVRDRVRAERARIRMVDRLRGSLGSALDVGLRGGERERGVLRRVGSDWLLLESSPGLESLVPLSAVVVMGGLGRRAAEPGSEGPVQARLDLRHALRAVVRDRGRVRLVVGPDAALSGYVERVGADHLELAEEPGGLEATLVPLSAIVVLRRFEGEL